MNNPYLELIEKRSQVLLSFRARREYCPKYSYAIPSKEALKLIASYSPIIEIGCGTGYWAYLLRQIGVDIVAVDREPGEKNHYHGDNKRWLNIIEGDESYLLKDEIKEHTLFLCWPPYNHPMAYNCLKNYAGKYFIYIGEGYGGCTGDEQMVELLDKEWDEHERLEIPQWEGIHDYLQVYRRR